MNQMDRTASPSKVASYFIANNQDKRLSLELDIKIILKKFKDHKYFHFENATDKQNSAGDLHALMAALYHKEFDTLVVSSIKDVCLGLFNEDDLHFFLSILSEQNIRVISLEDHLDILASQSQLILLFIKIFKSTVFDYRSANVRKGLQNAKEGGKTLGRPEKRNVQEIKELREKGFTMQKIAEILKLSVGSVHRALSS